MQGPVSVRLKNIIAGCIAITLVAGLITVAVKYAFGAFETGYHLSGSFAAAGQGLAEESDVKIRGVNVGKVTGVELRDGRALVTMRIDNDEQVPATSQATIRAKTLFGEKYVDIIPGDGEADGPYLAEGDVIGETLGGFELEQVLSDAYPILAAIDPEELLTVLHTLADAGEGLGEVINRGIVNGEKVLAVQAAHDADVREFLADFASLSDELAGRADDVTKLAADANVALPTLSENSGNLNALLTQTGRLAADLADILDNNRSFIDTSFREGQATVDLLDARRDDLIPLVFGLRQYVQTLTEAGHIPAGDGTFLAGVKGFLLADLCALPICGGGLLGPLLENQPPLPLDAGASTTAEAPPVPTTAPPAPNPVQQIVNVLIGILR